MFLFILPQILAEATDILLLASIFNIKLNQACNSIKLGLKELSEINNNFEMTETLEFIECLEESVGYLKEKQFKIQKCLDRDSYYELGNLLNSLDENKYCIIFHTAVLLNDHLKSSNSIQIVKEIKFDENKVSSLENSCSYSTFKIGKKISEFILKIQSLTKIYKIVKNWADFFKNFELVEDRFASENQDKINEKQQVQDNIKQTKAKKEKNQEKIDKDTKNKESKSTKKGYSFFEELYCSFKKIFEILDYVGENFFTRYYRKMIQFLIDRYYSNEDLLSYNCAFYKYDTSSLFWRFWFILYGIEINNVEVNDLAWALGILQNIKLENSWNLFSIDFNGFPNFGLNGMVYISKKIISALGLKI